MTAGGTLTVATRVGGGKFFMSIADTGTGISPEAMRTLFEPFFTTKPEGTGLGLAISRRIVEAHAGRITVQSRPGQGSEFLITLPLAASVQTKPSASVG
jgi:signal transduction histidine kinase